MPSGVAPFCAGKVTTGFAVRAIPHNATMELTPLQAVRELVEQQTTLADPAERDRALRSIEDDLYGILEAITTYRGDTQVQMSGEGQQPEQPEQPEPDSTNESDGSGESPQPNE